MRRVSGSLEFVSREPMTFPCWTATRRRDADSAVQGVTRRGRGARSANRWGETAVREPPDEPCPWGGARRSASLPPRGVDDNGCVEPLLDDFAKPKG